MNAGRPETAHLAHRHSGILGLHFRSTYADLPADFHSPATQIPLRSPALLCVNEPLADSIGLDYSDTEATTAVFNADRARPGSKPVAMAYGGHQFGSWVPQLGDGRGLLLGEAADTDGCLLDLHIKGSGTGRYSRGFDGRAVLRSSMREYLCSEAMHALGVPTTRGLCLIASKEPVLREQLETGALLVRTSHTHVRFGSFEYFHYRGDEASVRLLADYVLKRNFPHLAAEPAPYSALLKEVIERTARTIAAWQAWGFCHGVMNTDNMSIVGETLDYGPFGFLDRYQPGYICNTSDQQGRYAYNHQPRIGLWNCHALASALRELVPEAEAKQYLAAYEPAFKAEYLRLMRRRLGLGEAAEGDLQLVSQLLELMATEQLDYSFSLRQLAENPRQPAFAAALAQPQQFDRWQHQWRERIGEPDRAQMLAANPAVLLRNWLAQRAIADAQRQDYREFHRLLTAVTSPFSCQQEDYCQPPPEGADGIRLSCSS